MQYLLKNESNMSIESVTKDENLRGAYIVKLTQNMDNQTVYVVSVLDSSQSFLYFEDTVSKIE